MVLTRSVARSLLPADASAAVLAPEPVAAPAPVIVAEEDPSEEDPEELVHVEDLTEEDDEEEMIHLEDPPEAEDAPAKAAHIGHGGAPGLGAVPPPLPPPQPETWTVRFHHHPGDCYFSRALRMLFHHLHILVEIDYVGAERTHPHYTEEWIVSSHILAPDYEHGGTVEMAVHYALLTRATIAAGISDAPS